MGGGASAEQKRVTIEREAFDAVHVSEDVLDRLRHRGVDDAQPTSSYSDEQLKNALEEARSANQRNQKELQTRQKTIENLQERISSLEKDLQNSGSSGRQIAADNEYFHKMKELTEKQQELQETMKQQFRESMTRVSSRFFDRQRELVCADLYTSLQKCYMDNPGHSLNCSQFAKDFQRCVFETRAEMLARTT